MNGWSRHYPPGKQQPGKRDRLGGGNPAGFARHVMDPDRMAQAIGNLLSNAVKFTPTGGKVSITVKFMDEQLIVRWPIPDRAFRLKSRRKFSSLFIAARMGRRIVQGMGLGLSIARDIVTAHGGEIELQSEPGAGSRFTLRVPNGVSLTDIH